MTRHLAAISGYAISPSVSSVLSAFLRLDFPDQGGWQEARDGGSTRLLLLALEWRTAITGKQDGMNYSESYKFKLRYGFADNLDSTLDSVRNVGTLADGAAWQL